MKGRFAFGVALIMAVMLGTLEAMFPISRFLSKIDRDAFAIAKGIFVESVLPRLAIGAGFATIAVYLRAQDSRLAWPMLLVTPIGLLGADLVLRAFSA